MRLVGLVEELLNLAFAQHTGDCAGDTADHQVPGHAPVGVVTDFAFQDAGHTGTDQPDPVGGKKPEHGHERPEVQGHVE